MTEKPQEDGDDHSKPREKPDPGEGPKESGEQGGEHEKPGWLHFLLKLLVISLVVFLLGLVDIYYFELYGITLFVVMPLVVGLVTPVLYGLNHTIRFQQAVGVALSIMLIQLGTMFFLAVEGLICIAMAAPLMLLSLIIGVIGGYFTHRQLSGNDRSHINFLLFMAVFVTVAMGMESRIHNEETARPVRTNIVIDAPPEEVWNHIVSFTELPEPDHLYFKLGIAYPTEARIEGKGKNAVRYCEFTTGDFVEPVTTWKEPELLEFDVTKNPPPMKEISIWEVKPPHLENHFESVRGSFRLVPIDGGRTRLIGTTWYRNNLWPVSYWRLWSDDIIQQLHLRVLRHIRNLSEGKDVQNDTRK